MSENIIPWEQQPGESEFEFSVFKLYLELGTARSFQKIAKIYFRSKRTIANWAKKWKWSKRVKQYEDYIEENVHSRAFEFIRLREKEKYQFKLQQADLSLQLAKAMQYYYDNYEKSAKNDILLKEMRFLRQMVTTINMLMKSSDFSLSDELLRSSFKNDISIEQLINNEGQSESGLNLKENNNINFIFNSLTGYLNSKSEKIGAIDATSSVHASTIEETKELPNP